MDEQKIILIADDDAQMRLSLRHILVRAGYLVDEASNGREAVLRINAREGGYDVVLMDIIMPDQEGIETILHLRKNHPDLRIIAMSGGARLYDFNPPETGAGLWRELCDCETVRTRRDTQFGQSLHRRYGVISVSCALCHGRKQ